MFHSLSSPRVYHFCSLLFMLYTYCLLSHTFYRRQTVVFRASNPPWRRMGRRGAWHPATIPFFKGTVKARGKLSCKRERHRQKNPGELRRRLLGSHRSCRDYSNLVPGHPGYSVLLRGIVHVPDHGEGGAEGNNSQTVAK